MRSFWYFSQHMLTICWPSTSIFMCDKMVRKQHRESPSWLNTCPVRLKSGVSSNILAVAVTMLRPVICSAVLSLIFVRVYLNYYPNFWLHKLIMVGNVHTSHQNTNVSRSHKSSSPRTLGLNFEIFYNIRNAFIKSSSFS